MEPITDEMMEKYNNIPNSKRTIFYTKYERSSEDSKRPKNYKHYSSIVRVAKTKTDDDIIFYDVTKKGIWWKCKEQRQELDELLMQQSNSNKPHGIEKIGSPVQLKTENITGNLT